jgi:ribosomal protein L11 methyltransferase
MKSFSRMSYFLDEAMAEAVSPALFALGCEGIEEKAGNEYLAYFSGDSVAKARLFLAERNVRCSIVEVEDRDWHAEWKKNMKPVQLTDKFWVAPCWLLGKIPRQKTLLIEPKMAFGTGHHETTRLCARYLEKYAPGAQTLLDVGTGSGLLAILGEKLGMRSIIALDNDAAVRGNIEENLKQNDCARVGAFIGTLEALKEGREFDLVTANIISSVIVPMLPRLHGCLRKNSKLILSGLLTAEKETFKKLLSDNNFIPVNDNTLGEWWSVVARQA